MKTAKTILVVTALFFLFVISVSANANNNNNGPSAGYTIGSISGNTTEAGGSATFTLRLNTQPLADVTIGVSSSDTTEGTVSPSSLTFGLTNWNVDQTVTVTGVDDLLVDGDIEFSIVLAAPILNDPNYNGRDPADVSVINADNDAAPAGFTISLISGNTTEAGGSATFTIKLNSVPTANVTISLSSSDIGEGTVSPSTLTFTALNWNLNQLVTVTGVDDDQIDGDIEFSIVTAAAVSLNGNYDGLNPADVSVTNTDGDSAGFTLDTPSASVFESGGLPAVFSVQLTSQPTADVTIAVSSSDTTEGTVSPSSLTFTSLNWNAVDHSVTVTKVDDDLVDGDQNYSIVLGAAVSLDLNYNGVNPTDVNARTTDDDSAGFTISPISGNTAEDGTQATCTVRLTSEPTADVTFAVTILDASEATVSPSSLTFKSDDWNADQIVTATGVDDDIVDGNIVYTIILGGSTSDDSNYNRLNPDDVTAANIDGDSAGFTIGLISGNTGEDGTQATFTVKLTSEPTDDVIIGVSSSDTTEGTVSASSLTFTSENWNANQTITVTGINDDVADGNQGYSSVLAAASSDDSNYDGLDPADVNVTNTDNDSAGFTIGSISGSTVEDGTQATFTVKLTSEPTDDVIIGVSSSDTTEGTVSASSLTFTSVNWDANQTITITGVNDDVADGNQGYSSVLAAASSDDSNYDGLNPSDVSVTNTDNDSAGFTIGTISGSTVEDGTQATFTVKLTSEPTDDVTIGVSSSDSGEGTVSPTSLTFTSLNWNANQTITITGINDDVADGNQSFNILLAAASSDDSSYDGINPSDVSVTNTDDETAGVIVSEISGNIMEDGSLDAIFTVRLQSQPIADVTINLSSSDETEGVVLPETLTFTALNWNENQTVTVVGEDDFVADGNQDFNIILAAANSDDSNYDGLDPSDINDITNTDDETAGFVISLISDDTTEAGDQATFTINLASEPLEDVVIGLSSSDEGEGILLISSITFTAANWDTAQSIAITGIPDTEEDGDQSYSIVLGVVVSLDEEYNGLDPRDVSAINLDVPLELDSTDIEDAIEDLEDNASDADTPADIPSEVDNSSVDDNEGENLDAAGCVGGTITSKSNNNGFIIMIIFMFAGLIGLRRRLSN